MATCRPSPPSLLVVFGLLVLSSQTEGRGVQEELSPDFTAGSFLRGKDERLERSRLIPDQLLHDEKVLDALLVGSDQQTMVDRLKSVAEISPNTRQENGSEPQQRLLVSRKLLYNQTVCESEPDQQNPQMDQVAHEVGPVSKTFRTLRTSRTPRTPRTAPSPDDPLVEFDQQQIVMLADDEVVRTAAASLYHKHPAVSSLHAVRPQHRVQQVKGQAAPLSERSSLVLVGHGAREPSGEMRISGYSYQDVARIIQSSSRIGQKIQTTAVVACGVGSDRRFPQALLQTLHEAGLETELHLWKTAVQVVETGDVLSQDGARWRSGDHTKKLVLTVGRTGEIRRRDDRRHTGQEVPTNQTALLGKGDVKLNFREQWPTAIRSFIDNNIYEKVVSYLTGSQNVQQKHVDKVRETFRILEGFTWGLFHPEPPGGSDAAQPLNRVEQPDVGRFIIGERDKDGNVKWLDDNNDKENVLQRCYVIETGSDIRNIIRHFAKDGENGDSYLLIQDWLFLVQPDGLYVYPIGKRIREDEGSIRNAVMDLIQLQNREGEERYVNIKRNIQNSERETFVDNVKNIFQNQPLCLAFNAQLFTVWYFTASVIAESARNFRTFPLTLMAVSMNDNRFWFDPKFITMADGGTWLNKPLRGFSGSAEGYPEKLAALLGREYNVMRTWQQTAVKDHPGDEFTVMAAAAQQLNVLQEQEKQQFIDDCRKFVRDVENQHNIPSASGSRSNIHPKR